ncbi:CRISPR-associated protein [Desulfitobacterium hafniense]|uniref:CRISPR-associated protein, CT1132 n=1 Tax=Desulfitobacterium hafniense TaxID=49338 RepID=A0A098B3G5_DESHA|nr:type I CRISPR-associated protein Cas7 [Desulfitobacterium hafniense]CDX02912.1 CRISPR-associated protein, CT1132 [Desulfitobacterium hafniense]
MGEKSMKSGEILFVKAVKDGIPNRDPLNDSDARRLFPEEDGRISLSDVSIKRDVRDFVIDLEEDGGKEQKNHIFVQEKVNDKGKLLGRGSLAEGIAKRVGKEKKAKEDMKSVLIEHCFDVRTFGIVYSVKPKFNLTGPVQFGWAHSLHPVDTQYVQGTVVMPSTDSTAEGEGKTQGTIWTSYTVPFAVFVMPAVINAKAAQHSGMTPEDQELLLRALWQGTQHRQARGRGQQQPLILIHIEYSDPFYRIGYLEDLITMSPGAEAWKASGKQPSSLQDVSFDLTRLLAAVAERQERIARCRIWVHPGVTIIGDIGTWRQPLW